MAPHGLFISQGMLWINVNYVKCPPCIELLVMYHRSCYQAVCACMHVLYWRADNKVEIYKDCWHFHSVGWKWMDVSARKWFCMRVILDHGVLQGEFIYHFPLRDAFRDAVLSMILNRAWTAYLIRVSYHSTHTLWFSRTASSLTNDSFRWKHSETNEIS